MEDREEYSDAPAPRSGVGAVVALAALFGLGALLRIQGVFRYALEQDELYTIIEATHLWNSPLTPGIESRPLYYLLQHVLLQVMPANAVAIRAPALVFGLLGLALTWWIGRRLFGEVAGLAALALLAISPWHLYASGMARYWSLIYLIALGFYYLLVRSVETDRPVLYAGTLVLGILGTATHPTFMFPAAGACAAVLLVRDDSRLGWRWPSRRATAVLWGPMMALLIVGALTIVLTGGSAVQNWGGRGWQATLRLLPGMVDWTTPALAVAGGIGALLLICGSGNSTRRRWGAMAILGSAAAVTLLLAAAGRTNVYADYALAALPLVVMSAGALAQLAAERVRNQPGVAAVVVVCLITAGVLPATASYISDGTRFDYRPVLRHVERTGPELAVAMWPTIVLRHYAPGLRTEELPLRAAGLDRMLARERDLWVVVSERSYGIVKDERGEVARWLNDHCRLELFVQRPRFDHRRYRVELHRCTEASPGAVTAGATLQATVSAPVPV